jgi:hypothetical protein
VNTRNSRRIIILACKNSGFCVREKKTESKLTEVKKDPGVLDMS